MTNHSKHIDKHSYRSEINTQIKVVNNKQRFTIKCTVRKRLNSVKVRTDFTFQDLLNLKYNHDQFIHKNYN